MKKTSIKVFGVCAATLLTLGAVAPVAVHAEEVTATNELIQERAQINTPNNLKKNVDLTSTDVVHLLNGLKAPNIRALFETNDVNVNDVNVDAIDISTSPTINNSNSMALLFDDAAYGGEIGKNLGLPNDFEGKIIVATDASPNKVYNVGDRFVVTFWAQGYNTTSDTKYTKVGETTVHVKSYEETADYSVHATNINAQIGDIYNPAQNVTVKNKKEGYTINNAVYVFGTKIPSPVGPPTGAVAFFGPDGRMHKVESAYIEGLASGEATQVKAVDDQIKKVYGYNDNQYYILLDTSDFAGGVDNVKTETITNGGLEYYTEYYNTDIKDFNQQLRVIIPTDLKGNEYPVLYANRMINVTGETEGETPEETKVPVYRAYNPNNGDHLFTTSLKEYNEVVDKGWAPEGLAWNAATEEDGTKPVYRLYNPNSGEHFYTDSEKEYNEVAAAGWNKEGIAFYSAASEDGVKIFRSFNPNATGPGSHMFTDSEKEYNELTAAGWSPEGVAFYGMN